MMMSRKALEEYGLVNLGKLHWNLPPAILVEHALQREEGKLAANGAFCATTGAHTGRSPKDKFIVLNDESGSRIWWGDNNHPMSPETFEIVRRSLADYLQGRDVYMLTHVTGCPYR
jgi:phosphoenolpyruvate carboxykinase (ATP)